MNIKYRAKLTKLGIICASLLTTIIGFSANVSASADFSFTVTPMKENLILNPGDSYSSSVEVYIPPNHDTDVKYSVEVGEYYVDEKYNNIFEDCDETYCQMRDWITLNSSSEGILSPGETATIYYTVNVPYNAAGGGQYASILITGDASEDASSIDKTEGNNSTAVLTEIKRIAHTIYAEVAGDVVHGGEITEANVPGFLISGNIQGSALVKNTGNTHSDASYKLQVFPLFSNEEVYTNEENPMTSTILPGRSRYNVTEWDKTPAVGIFNVIYTAEFEGVETKIEKMVIICPIWLLFIIIFVIVLIILWLIMKSKSRKKSKR